MPALANECGSSTESLRVNVNELGELCPLSTQAMFHSTSHLTGNHGWAACLLQFSTCPHITWSETLGLMSSENPSMALKSGLCIDLKEIQIGNRGVKLFWSADGMILYIKDPRISTGKLLEIIDSFTKMAGHKACRKRSCSYFNLQ